jgi:membrane protease YdiL (CAAX protease family)
MFHETVGSACERCPPHFTAHPWYNQEAILDRTHFCGKMNVMKRQKTTPQTGKLTSKTIFASLTIIALWWLFWLSSQALFMVDVPILSKWLISSDPQHTFGALTVWIVVVNLIALAVYHWLQHDYSFLKIKDRWDILAYLLPVGLAIVLLLTKSSAFGVPMLIYVGAIVVTTFCQELLSTGFLQTGLARRLGPVLAAALTCIIFYLGHFMIADTATLMGGVIVVGFMLFSWLRYKRGNIYLANTVHLTWSLVMVLVF